MKKNKGKEIFQNATVQCQHCGRYFIRRLAHQCTGGYRKHHHKWLDITHNKTKEMKDEELILKAVEYCNDIPARVEDFLREEKPTVKAEPKPEFKDGQWIIGENGYSPKYPARILRMYGDNADLDIEDGDGYTWKNESCVFWRLLTPQEIESHLMKIAKEKGFVDGVNIRGLRFEHEGVMKYQTEDYHGSGSFNRYVMCDDCLNVSNETKGLWEVIYKKGKWATIIPQKKKLPMSKGGIILLIKEMRLAKDIVIPNTDIDDFLDLYED